MLDPADVEWIWLTHPDRDHTGALFDLLDAAPRARLITTFAGVGIMSCARPVPMDRVYLLNPGRSLDVGDRTLTALRPPLFDNPSTVGFYDDRSEAYFSSDCFGAPMETAELATANDVGYSTPNAVRSAQHLWATVDSPWVHLVDETKFLRTVAALRALDPRWILEHPPPPGGRTHRRVSGHARRGTEVRPLHRARPGRTRADAGRIRACRVRSSAEENRRHHMVPTASATVPSYRLSASGRSRRQF